MLVVGVCFQAQVTFDMVPGAFIEVGVPPDEEIMQILDVNSTFSLTVKRGMRKVLLPERVGGRKGGGRQGGREEQALSLSHTHT